MENLFTTSNIMFALGIIGMLFSIYIYFKKPQDALEKQVAVDQTAVDGKAALLAQQVQWEKEATEKRFKEFGERLDSALALAQNHIHTVDTKVDGLSVVVNKMSVSMERLATIIDERIPKK